MKLQTWSPINTPRFVGGKPIISAFNTGRIGFSTKALENLSLLTQENKYITLHHDEGKDIWYISISDKELEGFLFKPKATSLQNKFIAQKMLLPDQDKCRFLIGESIEHEGKTLYELIRLDRNE